MSYYEDINNISLIKNNINHINLESESKTPSLFRIGKESHHILLRSMVESLKGSANIEITGKSKDKKRQHRYKLGNNPWKEIHKVSIKECHYAWRFSEPKLCDPPKIENLQNILRPEKYLKGFYDLLAMIQSDCFMSRYVMSTPVHISDQKILSIEWLHGYVRNEFEHFIPKTYSVNKKNLKDASLACLELAYELLFDSKNVLLDHENNFLKHSILKIIEKLKNLSL